MRLPAPDDRLFRHAVLPRAVQDALLVEYRRLADEHGPQSAQALRARNRIVEVNCRLVGRVAKRYSAPRGWEREDLHAYGMVGLITAVERFDPTRGAAFSTMATWWIRHSIGRAIANLADVVRVPVHASERSGAASESIKLAAHAARRVSSLDAPLGGEPSDPAGQSLGDVVADARRSSALDELITDETEVRVRRALDALPDRLRDVVRARIAESEPTLKDVGDEMGLSREGTRQLELEAHGLLRRGLGAA